MKARWQSRKLGELCSIELGKTPSRSSKAFWDESRETNNVWLSIADLLNAEDGLVSDSKEYLSDAGAALCKTVRAGTLLVSFKLTLGRMAFAGRDLFTNEAIAALGIFNEAELSKDFLFYFFHFFDWRKAAENDVKLKGMTLNKAKLKEIVVSFPEPAEQKRIVAFLNEAFVGIANALAAAEQNRQNARALFESHLQSVFSQQGVGWVEKPLCEVAAILNGYAFKSGDFSSEGATKSIKITNVGVREFVETSDSGLPAEFAEQFASVAAPAGSLVIALTRTIIADGLKVAVVPPAYDRALVNQRVAALLPKPEEISASYLFAYLSTPIVLNYVKDRVNTLMQPNLSINDLRAMPVPLPPASERENIIDRINALEEETRRLESLYQRKLEALDELKQSLLHQAFSGQI